ncbi:MAG: PIN domain-containing protein [Syntrophobacteraceae bacterium]
MPGPEAFIDTNVLLYLLSLDNDKADRAENILRAGGLISVQVLNEMASVARRKLAMTWQETDEVLTLIRSMCRVVSLTVETHARGIAVAKRYGLNLYDAMIVAAALLGNCKTLYSEDMCDGLVIESRLLIRNPFIAHPSA